MAMGFTMGLNFLLLTAMVAANFLSLYHLLITTSPLPSTPVPDHLLRQLQTIRATINHLTLLQQQQQQQNPNPNNSTPPDLLLYSHLSPIPSSCNNHLNLLHQFMTYTPFSLCPLDSPLAESLILRGCHPLPRRRCFSPTPPSLSCNNTFNCLNRNLGFDFSAESRRFVSYKSTLDLTIPQLIDLAASSNSPIRLGIDVGGGTGTFAAKMKERNATIVTTTMNLGLPYSEAVSMRGLVPIHAPLQQRLPVFDGVVDLVRCGRAVNRWIPAPAMEFLMFDLDRVLRGGGFLWLDRFFCKGVDLERVYRPLIERLGYRIVKWATGNKTDSGGGRNKIGEVYLTALLQKPNSRRWL